MVGTYIAAFSTAFAISLVLTPVVRRLAFKVGAVDKPNKRKVHDTPVPRLGGVAIITAFVVTFLLFIDLNRAFIALLLGVLILFGMGLVDDIKRLPAWQKLAWQIVATLVVLAGGIGIVYLTNPIGGGVIPLGNWQIPFDFNGTTYNILPIANAVSVLWIVGMINTINFLDGLDGLAGGISSIAALALFILAVTSVLASPVVAVMAIILLGALLGFLPYNFYPGSIFMGDSGSYAIGLLLALISIYAGSKIAIGAIVLGFAIIDAIWAVLRRLLKRQSPFKPDRGHLHHRLLDTGLLSHRQVVLLLYAFTVAVAGIMLLFGGWAAFVLMLLLLGATMSVVRFIAPLQKRRS